MSWLIRKILSTQSAHLELSADKVSGSPEGSLSFPCILAEGQVDFASFLSNQ